MKQIVIALVIASRGFQEQEYSGTRKALEDAGFKIMTVSDTPGPAVGHKGKQQEVDRTIDKFYAADADGVFFIGGPGALACLDNQQSYRVLAETVAVQKPYGAICISPRILARAGVLNGKRATCWDEDGGTQEVFDKYKVEFVKNEPVVQSGLAITANSPKMAGEFGQAIITLFKNYK